MVATDVNQNERAPGGSPVRALVRPGSAWWKLNPGQRMPLLGSTNGG
jgi:hypothetical protein